jgi:hypothetical protein
MLQQSPQVRGTVHRIELIMSDGTQIHVTPRVLDVLLDTNRVIKFKRSSGWVTIGLDPVRAKRRSDYCEIYNGIERRVIY